MARLPWFVIPGHPQHIIERGNNLVAIFYADKDYAFYLERLMESWLGKNSGGSLLN